VRLPLSPGASKAATRIHFAHSIFPAPATTSGEKLIKFLVGAKLKGLPVIETEEMAKSICEILLRHEYFHRSEKAGKGMLEVSKPQNNVFVPEGYYTWMYHGSRLVSHFMTGVLIVGFLTITCFPIWPQFLKVWMWYLSVTLLVFMLGFLSIRGLLWFFMWCMGYDFWVLPRLFDESLGIAESFVPVYSFEGGSPGQGYYRSAAVLGIVAFVYWAYTQPTEFDSFISAQRDFVHDLYEGNLLADVSQESKENIDKPRVQSLEDILRELDEEEDEDEDEQVLIDALLADEFGDDEDFEEDEDEHADEGADDELLQQE
jgi:translocation protein SEC62